MNKLGDILWNLGVGIFIISCCIMLAYNDKQIDIGLQNEAYSCIEHNYSVQVGKTVIDTENIEDIEEFLMNYKVLEIDDSNKTVIVKPRK